MPRFSARTIAIVRRNVNEMFTDTCTLYVESGATGTMGEPQHTLEIAASNASCRVIRASQQFGKSSVVVVGSQEAMVELYRLECPYDTTLTVDMVAKLSDGSMYQIVGIEDKLTDSAFAGAVITRVRT